MELDLTGLHIEVTEGIRDYAERKIAKLAKFFEESTICHVTFSVNKNIQHVDMRIEFKGKTFMAEADNEELYVSIDECVEKIEGQVRKAKTVMEKSRRDNIPGVRVNPLEDEE